MPPLSRLVSLLVFLVGCATPPAPSTAASQANPPTPGVVVAPDLAAPEPPAGMRLPTHFKALAQRVELSIVPASEHFQGTTELDVDLQTATDTLWLNARGLTVQAASARLGDTEVPAQLFTSPERVALRFPRTLGTGRATLRLSFTGLVSGTDDYGIFHQQEGGEWYATTQFEETDARRAFPCVDEPSAKIPWELTLVVPKALTAVSNTPVASEEAGSDGMKRVHFARTKPLPSYLVAFAVGPYDFVDARPAGQNKVPMRIYTPRGRAPDAAYAVRTAPELLETLEAYFARPYPYEKLDLLVIPLTVHFSAMENAGLVTFSSSTLLARPEAENLQFRRRLAAVTAHEFAHQWFGDLVTLSWWNDTWLNEAFASWMGAKALETWAPSWQTQVSDILSRSRVANQDTLVSARRIRQPIESYDDIANAFDGITYQKGAAVLRMFEAYLGAERFRTGVQLYLRRYAYGNATAADFLAAISEATGEDVAPAFGTFLDQPGVPVVTVRLSCPRGKPAELSLAQERLLPVGTTGKSDTRWQVPVCARWSSSGREQRACTLLKGATGKLALDGTQCPAWVLPNAGYTGYYRLNLEAGLLRTLTTRTPAPLTTGETVGLLGDVEALVTTGTFPQGTGMELAARLAHASQPEVVSQTIDLARVQFDFLDAATRQSYAAWVRRHFGAQARALGMEGRGREEDETRLLRPRLVTFVALRGEDPQLISAAQAVTQRWLKDAGSVDQNMVDSALVIAGYFGDATLHAQLVERLKASQDRAIRAKAVTALAAFQKPALVEANMALMEAAPVDRRELSRLLLTGREEASLARFTPLTTRETIFRAVSQQFERFTNGMPERSVAGLFRTGAFFCDAPHRQEVDAAFAPRAPRALGGLRILAQVLESIDLCLADREVQTASITQYLTHASR
jgi:cytosol alanyl aminopeptidase